MVGQIFVLSDTKPEKALACKIVILALYSKATRKCYDTIGIMYKSTGLTFELSSDPSCSVGSVPSKVLIQ